MAGHSHWANIQHKKALLDNKRGKAWSRLAKAVISAAKMGGGDPVANVRLRYAIDDAKAANMPSDTIKRAIQKGTGELEGGSLDEVLYEGYGAGGAAILCEILTDNRNRTAPEIRKIFEVYDGKLGGTNCVSWMFDRKALFLVAADNEEKLMELALEAGADDVKQAGEQYEVICDPSLFDAVSKAITAGGYKVEASQITRIPKNTVELDADAGAKVLKLIEKLDDHDDVQSVATNYSVPDGAMT